MFAEQPDAFLRDFGVPCTAAGRSFTGILDTPDEGLSMAGVNVLSTMYTLVMTTADQVAAGITSGSGIAVNGVAYVVRDVLLQDDGTFTQLNLSR